MLHYTVCWIPIYLFMKMRIQRSLVAVWDPNKTGQTRTTKCSACGSVVVCACECVCVHSIVCVCVCTCTCECVCVCVHAPNTHFTRFNMGLFRNGLIPCKPTTTLLSQYQLWHPANPSQHLTTLLSQSQNQHLPPSPPLFLHHISVGLETYPPQGQHQCCQCCLAVTPPQGTAPSCFDSRPPPWTIQVQLLWQFIFMCTAATDSVQRAHWHKWHTVLCNQSQYGQRSAVWLQWGL